MKTLILASALISSFSASAALTTYDCGYSAGKQISLTVSTAKEGSLFDFTGTFIAPSRDLVTRIQIPSLKFSVAGDIEEHDGTKFYILSAKGDSPHKVVVKVGKKLGQKVELVDLDTNVGIDRIYNCTVVKLIK